MTKTALHRIGKPSPLPFHLNSAVLAYAHALQMAPNSRSTDFPWHPDLQHTELPAPSSEAVMAEALLRLCQMLDGIELWQRHPYRRVASDRPIIWCDGSSRLLDYGGIGQPVLVLPSLINQAYILDLLPERSMLQYLSNAGLHPYLLDWGTPKDAELAFDLDAYTSYRLLPALAAVAAHAKQRPALLGYCMGGTLAAGLAAQQPPMTALVTIGAPWKFAQGSGVAAQIRAAARTFGVERTQVYLRQLVEVFGQVPVEFLQGLFAAINPIQAARKFRAFSNYDPNSEQAKVFVALEDWLADGIPLAGPLAHDVMIDWQLRDSIVSGNWQLLGKTVIASNIECPTLVVTGRRDRIAPPEQALALGEAIPGAESLQCDLGHVSMVAGSNANNVVWRPIEEFLKRID